MLGSLMTLLSDKNSFKYERITLGSVEDGDPVLTIKTPLIVLFFIYW